MVKLHPGAQFQAQFDGAAIERIYHLFKTDPQFFIFVKHCGFLNQSHRKVLINTPILLLVGLCERGFVHHLDAGSIEVPAEVKCSLNISQTRAVGELSKAHHHEQLVSAIELNSVTVALLLLASLKYVSQYYFALVSIMIGSDSIVMPSTPTECRYE